MFNAIGDASALASETITQISRMTTLATDITNSLTSVRNMSWTIPAGLLVMGAISINPNIEMPSVPDFINPLDNIVSDTLKIDIDACHKDALTFGTLLNALMQGILMVAESALEVIIKSLYDAYLMFGYITDSASSVKNWVLGVISTIYGSMATSWRTMDNAMKDCFRSADDETDPIKKKEWETKGSLWKRALKWFMDALGKLGLLLRPLKEAVDEFLVVLYSIVEIISVKGEKLLASIGDMAKDLNCLTKASTKVVSNI